MSSAPMPTQQKGYDPEIEDIAKYVTKPIDSELAVSRCGICLFSLFSPDPAYSARDRC